MGIGRAADNKHGNAFTQIGINITNEMGQVRILDGRDVENNNDDHQDDGEHHGHSKVNGIGVFLYFNLFPNFL